MVSENNKNGSKRDPQLDDLEITPISTVSSQSVKTSETDRADDAPGNPNEGFSLAEETGDNLFGDVGDDDWGLLKRSGWNGNGEKGVTDGSSKDNAGGPSKTETAKPGTTSGAGRLDPELLGFKSLLDTAGDTTQSVSSEGLHPTDPRAVPLDRPGGERSQGRPTLEAGAPADVVAQVIPAVVTEVVPASEVVPVAVVTDAGGQVGPKTFDPEAAPERLVVKADSEQPVIASQPLQTTPGAAEAAAPQPLLQKPDAQQPAGPEPLVIGPPGMDRPAAQAPPVEAKAPVAEVIAQPEIQDIKDTIQLTDQPIDPKKLEHLQLFLLDKFSGTPQDVVKQKLIEASQRSIEDFVNKLEPEARLNYAKILNSPERLNKLAETDLKERALKAVDDQLKSGKLPAAEADKLKEALNKGEMPTGAVKLLLESEKQQGQFGPCTKALYSTIIDTTQNTTRTNVGNAIFNGKPIPKTDALPFPVDATGKAALDAKTNDSAIKGDLDYVKLAPSTVPSETELKKLDSLIEFNKTFESAANPVLTKFQTALEKNVEKLDTQRLFNVMRTEAKAAVERQHKGKTPDEITQLAEQNLQQLVESSLTRQVKAGQITPMDKDRQLASAKEGTFTPATAADLLKQERLCNTEGVMTRATAHCVEGFFNSRIANAQERVTRDKLEVEPPPLKKGESASIGPPLPGEPIKVDTIAGAPEKIEKFEKWLETVEEKRNPQVDKLHGLLTGLSQTMDPSVVAEQLKQNMLPRVEEQFRKKQLPADVQKELASLDYRDDKAGLKAKMQEVAGEQLKLALKQELEAKVGAGFVDKAAATKMSESIDAGQAPEMLLQSMLQKERADNSFGPVTKAYYSALVSKLDAQVPANFVRLAQSGLPIPEGSPISVTLDREGRPESKSGMVAELARAQAEGRSPIKIINTVNNLTDIPTDENLSEIYKAARWNTNATIALFDNVQEYQAKMLDATIVKLGRQDWKRDVGTDRTEWMARVGPMVDLTMQVKATAQALKLAEKMAKSNASSLDPRALTKDFPGEVKFDKDGNIVDIKLRLPKDLAPSHENTVAIKEIQDWLKKHEAKAKETMTELAEAAANDSRILLWQDTPNKGKLMVNGKAEDFNLEKHKVRTEEVIGPDGKPRIRIHNYVDYHYSDHYNLWDIGAKKVGTREVYSLSSEAEVKQALKAAKVPADKIEALYKDIKETEANINKMGHNGDTIGDTKSDVKMMTAALKRAGVENPEKLREDIYKNYRDYEPGAMVCLFKDDQVQMIMAKNVEAWHVNEMRWQTAGKVATIAMDVGMVVCGVGHVALAVKGGMMLAKGGAVVLRQAIATAIKSNLKAAVKSFALGGSGMYMNNAATLSTPEGRTAHEVRNVIFVLDGVHSLAAMGKGAALAKGLLKGPAVTKESIALGRISKIMDKGNLVSKANSVMMGGTVLYMFGTLSSDLYKRFAGDHKQEAGLKYGERLLSRMNGDGNNATRFLRGTGDALAGGDDALKAKLSELSEDITKSQKLTGDARTKKTQELIDRFDKTKEPNERTMLALGVLALAQKPDGSTPADVGKRSSYRGAKPVDVNSKEFFKVVDDAYAAAKDNPDKKLMLGRSMIGLRQMDAPQYATMCRELIADEKSSKDVKIQAVLGIAECIGSIKRANSDGGTNDTTASDIFGAFGCSPAALEKTLADVAKTAKDSDVQAMATALLDAYKHSNPDDVQNLIAKASGDWQTIKLTGDIGQLEQKLAGLGPTDAKRKSIEKELHEKKETLDVTLKTIAISNDPNLLMEFAKSQQKADAERDLQAFRALTARADLGQLQKQLNVLPSDSPERAQLQEKIKTATEKAAEQETKLAQLEKAAEIPTVDPKLMPPVATSIAANLAARLIKDLNSPDAATALMAVDSLNLLRDGKGALKPNELRDRLAGLVKMDNGIVAVEALRRLLPDQLKELNFETKSRIKEEINQLLVEDTTISEFDKDQALQKKTDAAITKIALLGLAPDLFKTGMYGTPEKTEFVSRVVNLLDRDNKNNQYAKDFPDLRLAALNSLGGLKDVIKELPIERQKAVFDVIHASMKPASNMKEVGSLAMVYDGEPNSAIRRAAFQAGKALGDPQLAEFAMKNLDSESDPTLATEYGCLEFESLRPDRPDCALRIFEYETNYWSQVLDFSASRFSNDQAANHLKAHLRMVHPESAKNAHHHADIKLAEADKDATYWYGLNGSEWNAAVTKYRTPLLEESRNQWSALKTDAAKSGKDGDIAKASLMWLATMGDRSRQHESAKEIRAMVNNNIPDKELFYPGIIEAFRHDNTPDKHRVRLEFIGMLNDLIPDDPNAPAKISRQYAGRIVQEALRIELSRMSLSTEPGQPNYKDWKEGDWLPDGPARQYELIKLMSKCNYPLAMAELKAIATSQRPTKGGADTVIVHPKVKAAAEELYRKLQDTAPRTPADQAAAVKLLNDTNAGRINLYQKLTAGYNVTAAEKEFLASGKADDQASLKRRAEINAMCADGTNTMDSVTAKRNINNACSSNPIRTPDDTRIQPLRELLKDKDPGVALIAAWHLIKSVDPINTADEGSRAILQSQPFFKDAIAKMEELKGMKVTSEADGQTRAAAEKFLLIASKWNLKEVVANPLAEAKVPGPNDGIVGDALKKLDSYNFRATPAEKKDAIDTLVRVAAEDFHQKKPELQTKVEDILRQIASKKDATMSAAVLETIRRAERDNQPVKDDLDVAGKRILTFKNGTKTEVLDGLDTRQINYPDGTWTKFNFDSSGQVNSYEESANKGMLKTAGKDFVVGSVIAHPNGIVTRDSIDGSRSVKLPAGDSWTYFKGTTDATKSAKALDENLSAAKTAEEKIAAVNESIYGFGPESSPISSATDPRIVTLIGLMKPDGQATEDSKKLSYATARTLLEQRNKGIDKGIFGAAKDVFIKDELQSTFLKDVPTEKTLVEMHDAMILLGRVNVVDDPRRAMFVAALDSGDTRVKLAAARVVSDGHNTAFSVEERMAALKTVLNVTKNDKELQKDPVKMRDAFSIVESAGKAFGDFEGKIDDNRSITFKGGKLVKVDYPDGGVNCRWDQSGVDQVSFALKGKDVLQGDVQEKRASDSDKVSPLHWINAETASAALEEAIVSGNERIAVGAMSALANAKEPYHTRGVNLLLDKAVATSDGTAAFRSAEKLGSVMHNEPQDEQVHIRRSWEVKYGNSAGKGVAPYPIPEATLNKYKFPAGSDNYDKTKILLQNVGWVYDNAQSKLTGDPKEDAKKLSELYEKGAGINNHRTVVDALFASMKSAPITDNTDPRIDVIKHLSRSDNQRVALAASFALTHSTDKALVKSGTDRLIEYSKYNTHQEAEAKSILRDMVKFGGDVQHQAALESWQSFHQNNPTKEAPPKPSPADEVRRYFMHADAKTQALFYGQPLDVRKATVLAMHNLDKPNEVWTETQLEAAIQPPVYNEPIDPFRSLGRFNQDNPFSNPFSAFRMPRKRTRAESFLRFSGTDTPFIDLTGGGTRPQPKFLKVEDLKFPVQKDKAQLAAELQGQLNHWGTGTEVEIGKDGKIKLNIDAQGLGVKGKTQLKVTGGLDDDPLAFMDSAPPAMMAQFSRELLELRPDIAEKDSIDSGELAIMFKNWMAQKASGNATPFVSGIYHDNLAVDQPVQNLITPFSFEDRGRYRDRVKPELKARAWAEISKGRDDYRSNQLNLMLDQSLQLPKGADDGRIQWRAMAPTTVAKPDLVAKPPLEQLDRYRTNVIQLLPDALRFQSQVSIRDLKRIAAEGDAKDDIFVAPGLGRGTEFKLDDSSARIFKTIRAQKSRDGLFYLNLDAPKKK
ncbi:MAG: hypothetical protein SGJ27_18795 [Candidatus Melainabacteria bacterium]|nr:hypothetical protein [Candidatus Melainabacteria bacterium]